MVWLVGYRRKGRGGQKIVREAKVKTLVVQVCRSSSLLHTALFSLTRDRMAAKVMEIGMQREELKFEAMLEQEPKQSWK